MTKNYRVFPLMLFIFSLISCQKEGFPEFQTWVPYDETGILEASAKNESKRLQYKLIQSKISDRNDMLDVIVSQLKGFSKERYQELLPLVLDQSMEAIQAHISEEMLSYKELTQWYLYRIAYYESNPELALNAMISINPKVVTQAEALDNTPGQEHHPIFGMPIILKDNINTQHMPTTAGAAALQNNQPEADAEIVANIKSYGGLILGKANLSEWANYLCAGCPNGYSAIGGQTLNPYGVRTFDTGGSSSGSAVAVAANYAVAAVGSETSGSILSPSSQQSAVGLKPTIGSLSQDGIVPISSTLDTPGPITRNLDDNSILFSAMASSQSEAASPKVPWQIQTRQDLKGVRFGAFESYAEDSLYQKALKQLEILGAEIITIDPEPMSFKGFSDLLSADMKVDLKQYLASYASENIKVKSALEVMKFNLEDSTVRIPYGQARFEGIEALNLSEDELIALRKKILFEGIGYFENPILKHNLDVLLSINNYNAGQAAAAKYPALTVPMGYTENGEPKGLTFITKPYLEMEIYSFAKPYEASSQLRQPPANYSK